MKHYVICENDCLVEAMTKEEVITAIAEATGYVPTGEEEAVISQIINQNSGGGVKIWFGTRAEYNALPEKDANTIYHITDDKTGQEAYNKAVDVENLFKTYDSDLDGIIDNAKKLDGHEADYFATKTAVENAQSTADTAKSNASSAQTTANNAMPKSAYSLSGTTLTINW